MTFLILNKTKQNCHLFIYLSLCGVCFYQGIHAEEELGFWVLNSGSKAWWQVFLPTEPPHHDFRDHKVIWSPMSIVQTWQLSIQKKKPLFIFLILKVSLFHAHTGGMLESASFLPTPSCS